MMDRVVALCGHAYFGDVQVYRTQFFPWFFPGYSILPTCFFGRRHRSDAGAPATILMASDAGAEPGLPGRQGPRSAATARLCWA